MSFCICPIGRLVHGCPEHAPSEAATLESIHAMLVRIIEQQEKIMTAQDDVTAAAAAIQAVVTDLATAAANIQAEIADLNSQLAAAGSATVDTSALDSAVTALQAAQAGVDALETPAAPAPGDGTVPAA